jgi:solute carrier family 25 (peroxisomal adenine nucleotide transporter), member 17
MVPYAGTLDAIQRIIQAEGIGGLYAGLSASYIRDSLRNFLSFYFYELFKALYHAKHPATRSTTPASSSSSASASASRESADQSTASTRADDAKAAANKSMPVLINLAIASGSAALTQLMVNPINVAIARMQTKHSNLGLFATLLSIWHNEGVAGLYKGIIPALILTSNMAITFVVYEQLKKICLMRFARPHTAASGASGSSSASNATKPPQLSAPQAFAISAMSKVVATLATYPYMRAKTIMQTTKDSASTTQVLFHILSTEGITGLYTGLGAQLWKSALTSAILFMAKEKFIALIHRAMQVLNQQKPTTSSNSSSNSNSNTRKKE